MHNLSTLQGDLLRIIATTPRPTLSTLETELATTQGEHVPPGLVCPALDDLINKSLITAHTATDHTEYYTLPPPATLNSTPPTTPHQTPQTTPTASWSNPHTARSTQPLTPATLPAGSHSCFIAKTHMELSTQPGILKTGSP